MYSYIKDYVIALRRELHKIPELGTNLPKTQAFVTAELERLGIPYRLNTAVCDGEPDSGIIAFIEGKNTDKVIALRSDMDALPIHEEVDVEFKSQHEGCMHACGHDAHTAILLGACKLLKDNQDKLNGSVKILFQSAEEIVTGARMLVEGGALENPKVTAGFGMHVWPLGHLAPGVIATKKNTLMASGDRFKIHITGKGCHSYSPDRGVDPIVVAAQVINALQVNVSRERPVDEQMVISICQIHGGTAWNIIPDRLWLEGTARTMNSEMRSFVRERIEQITEGVCAAMRAKGEVEWVSGTPAVENDPELTDLVFKAAEIALGEGSITDDVIPTMGNEDVSLLFESVPSVFAFLNVTNKEKGMDHPLHSSKLELDEDVLWRASALYCQTALEYCK